MINSNPFTSLSGTVFLSIGMATNANVEIEDMGEVRYEFDLTPTDQTVRGIAGIPGAMTVTAWDRLNTGQSLYEAIEVELGTYDGLNATVVPTAPVTLYWMPRGETNIDNAWRFPFDLRFMDASIDERSQTTTLRLAPKSINLTMEQWGTGAFTNNFPTTNYGYIDAGGTRLSYLAGDFMYDIISEFDTGAGNTTIIGEKVGFPTSFIEVYFNTYPTTQELFSQNLNTAVLAVVFGPDQEYANANLAVDKVRVLSGIDSAFFGSAFNVNYYMPRLNNRYNVELTNVEFEELKFVTSPRNINAVALSYSNTNVINATTNIGNAYPYIFGVNIERPAWNTADQKVDIGFSSYIPQFNFGVWANNNPNFVDADEYMNPSSMLINPELGQIIQLLDSSISYSFGLGAWTSNQSVYKIEATVLGADKIRPYEVIKFDNTVPIRYQGKHFRPTSLSYDLKADKVRVTAYQIDTFELPQPNIVINVGACETGEMVSLFAYNTFAETTSEENGNFMASNFAYNTFAETTSEENGAYTSEQLSGAFSVTESSDADGNVSNVTGISL